MAKKKTKKATAGGKAEATGGNYETLVGAWYAHAILTGAEVPLEFPTDTKLVSLACQTFAPIDDVNAQTSDDGIVFVQAKRTLSLSGAANSQFASVVDQFVRQFQASELNDGAQEWSRALDPARDRLVLATRSASSPAITRLLPRLLRGLRDTTAVRSLRKIATSQAERKVAEAVEANVKRSWKAAYGKLPRPEQIDALLRLMWVQVLDVESGERDKRAILDNFRAVLLEERAQAAAALAHLFKLIARLRADRSGADRPTLLAHLARLGIKLSILPDFRADIAALRKWTAARLGSAAKFTRLLEDDPALTIEREAWSGFQAAAEAGSLLLVGEPGAGKSGLTYRLGQDLLAQRRDIIFLPVDFLNVETFGALQAELGLTHDLDVVLANWPGSRPGILIVDALDAARKAETQRLLRDVIGKVLRNSGPRWTVVASVRKYDLRQGAEWARMFRGTPPLRSHVDREFGSVAHISVQRLTDAEIAQIATALPGLQSLFVGAGDKLRDLLRNIFNLHLLAELLRYGVAGAVLSSITTQAELLDSYWQHRVRGEDGKHDAREAALSVIVNRMIASQLLSVNRADIRPLVEAEALVTLEKEGILRADEQAGRPDDDTLLFSHHVLFDYTVARTALGRGRNPAKLVAMLGAQRELVLMLSPSLTLAISDVWAEGGQRPAYWALAFALAQTTGLPGAAQLAAPMISAENAATLDDFAPLLSALKGPEPARTAAENFVQNLVGAIFVRMRSGFPLLGDKAGPWMALCEELSKVGTDKMILAVRALVSNAAEQL